MKKLNRLFFSLTITWMAVIFIFSAQTGATSSNMSGGITEFIVSILFSNYEDLSPIRQQELLESANFFIRKGAHFTEFAILGLLALLTILTRYYTNSALTKIKNWKKIALTAGLSSLIFSFLYAVTDEFHQSFTDNRYPSAFDVLIDSSGALAGILFTLFTFYFFYIKKHTTT